MASEKLTPQEEIELDQLIEKFKQSPDRVIFHNNHFYIRSQIFEARDSIQKNRPIFYKSVGNAFIKY